MRGRAGAIAQMMRSAGVDPATIGLRPDGTLLIAAEHPHALAQAPDIGVPCARCGGDTGVLSYACRTCMGRPHAYCLSCIAVLLTSASGGAAMPAGGGGGGVLLVGSVDAGVSSMALALARVGVADVLEGGMDRLPRGVADGVLDAVVLVFDVHDAAAFDAARARVLEISDGDAAGSPARPREAWTRLVLVGAQIDDVDRPRAHEPASGIELAARDWRGWGVEYVEASAHAGLHVGEVAAAVARAAAHRRVQPSPWAWDEGLPAEVASRPDEERGAGAESGDDAVSAGVPEQEEAFALPRREMLRGADDLYGGAAGGGGGGRLQPQGQLLATQLIPSAPGPPPPAPAPPSAVGAPAPAGAEPKLKKKMEERPLPRPASSSRASSIGPKSGGPERGLAAAAPPSAPRVQAFGAPSADLAAPPAAAPSMAAPSAASAPMQRAAPPVGGAARRVRRVSPQLEALASMAAVPAPPAAAMPLRAPSPPMEMEELQRRMSPGKVKEVARDRMEVAEDDDAYAPTGEVDITAALHFDAVDKVLRKGDIDAIREPTAGYHRDVDSYEVVDYNLRTSERRQRQSRVLACGRVVLYIACSPFLLVGWVVKKIREKAKVDNVLADTENAFQVRSEFCHAGGGRAGGRHDEDPCGARHRRSRRCSSGSPRALYRRSPTCCSRSVPCSRTS